MKRLLKYTDTLTGDEKTVELADYEQDKANRWYSASCTSKAGHFYTISRYRHLWFTNTCIGTNVTVWTAEAINND